MRLADGDFSEGSLRLVSYARPGKLSTANRTLVVAQAGALNNQALRRLVQAVVDLLIASVEQ